MKLTDLKINKLKPRKDRYEIPDGTGLFIRVTPVGKKSWVFRYRFDGRQRRMTLGPYPALTLAQARFKYSEAMRDVEKGIDPAEQALEEKKKQKTAPTVKELLEEFWEQELQFKKTSYERRRLIEKDVIPVWGHKKVSKITRRQAVMLIDGVKKRAPITANRLQSVLVRMFNFACERGIIDHSPLSGMRRGKEASRSRVLTDQEIKILWPCLSPENKDIDIYVLGKLALKIILLTGQRPGEVVGMTWNEISDDMWIIPKERRKNDEENRIPILSLTSDIIKEAKKYAGDSVYVFPSSQYEDRPLTVGSLANALRRHRSEMGFDEPFTPHDLRRTFRTRLASFGVDDVIAERVLGHKLQGVLGIYNRHGYDTEKREALSLWEKEMRRILGITKKESKIIEFPGGTHD